jgi:uncharacterized membrane protein YqaE (UPF0057 family)
LAGKTLLKTYLNPFVLPFQGWCPFLFRQPHYQLPTSHRASPIDPAETSLFHDPNQQQHAVTMPFTASDICKIIVAVILPPLGVFFERGCGADLLINILLTVLGVCSAVHLGIANKSIANAHFSTFRASSTHST